MIDVNLKIEGEPIEAFEARHKILETFKDLEFYEDVHKYILHGKEIPSVSHVIHQFEEETDFDLIAERKAAREGLDKQELLDEWKFNNIKATTTGTLVHAFGESLGWLRSGHPELITEECKCKYVAEKNWLIPTRKKEEAIIKFMNDLPSSYHLVLNEAKVHSGLNADEDKNPKQQYAGTFDMLYYFDGNGNKDKAGFVILDFKTNASLENDFARSKGKFLLPPLNSMYAEAKSIYTAQLSAYQIPLEDIELKVIGRRLIWLKEDGSYEKIALPDITEILRKTL